MMEHYQREPPLRKGARHHGELPGKDPEHRGRGKGVLTATGGSTKKEDLCKKRREKADRKEEVAVALVSRTPPRTPAESSASDGHRRFAVGRVQPNRRVVGPVITNTKRIGCQRYRILQWKPAPRIFNLADACRASSCRSAKPHRGNQAGLEFHHHTKR